MSIESPPLPAQHQAATPLNPSAPLDRITSRLARVRQGIAARLWIAGLTRFLWLVIALAVTDLTLDWLFHLDRPQRAVLLAFAIVLFGWNAYRWLIRPLTTPTTDDALALELESANPRLGQALITSLQLAKLNDKRRAGMSPALVEQAITSGAKIADEISFEKILDSRRFAQNALLLLAALFCFLSFTFALPFATPLRIWLSRNLFLSTAAWPQRTDLIIQGLGAEGTVPFPRGGDWTQLVVVGPNSSLIPDLVHFESRGPGSSASRRSMAMQRTGDREFATTFVGVTEPFEFRARGGDAITEWTRAVPVAPPALSELTITAIPPRYTGQTSEELPPGQSPYQLLRGSSLKISATANKLLESADLARGDMRWSLIPSSAPTKQLSATIPAAQLAADSYAIRLVDTLGLTSATLSFGIQWRPDHPPQVTARLSGIGNVILPQAQIPYTCQVVDDYGLTAFTIVSRVNQEADPTTNQQHTLSLTNPLTLGQPGEPTPHRELTVQDAIDLLPLKLTAGTNLALRFDATDNSKTDNSNAGDNTAPNVGHSSEFLLRVVTEAEFRSELLRREKMERQELEFLAKTQDDLLTDSRALTAALRSSPSLTTEQTEWLPKIHRGQKLVGQKLAAIADRLTALADEVRNNRLPDPSERIQNRLNNQIAAPLRNLATQAIPPIVQSLDKSRLNDTTDRGALLTTISTQQADIATRLKQVLAQMTSSEGFQEAIDLLYEIQKAQGEVHDQTNKAREERIRKILEGRP